MNERRIALGLSAILCLLATCRVAADFLAIILHPSGSNTALARGSSQGRRVGYGYGEEAHAPMWSSSARDYIDLHHEGYEWSSAYAASDSQQVGSGAGEVTGGYRYLCRKCAMQTAGDN